MSIKEKIKPLQLVIPSLLILLGLCFVATGVYFYNQSLNSSRTSNKLSSKSKDDITPAQLEIKPIKPTKFKTNLTFLGDVFWGRYINDWSQKSDLGFKYPFSGLNTIGKADDEFWVAGLECPVTDYNISSAEQENLLKFNCKPEYLEEAKKWFDAFSLANNHTDNMNEIDGFEKTKDYLDKAEIKSFGHYDNKVDEICKAIEVPVTPVLTPEEEVEIKDGLAKLDQEKYTSKIAFCGFHGVFRVPLKEELDQIEVFSKNYPTFVMPHMGSEYTSKPDALKENIYRQMIDKGALAVIGNHPHSIQYASWYNGKLIAYSLGNLIFDQQSGQMTTTSIILQTQLELDYKNSLNPNTQIKYGYKVTENSQKLVKIASKNNANFGSKLFIFNSVPEKSRITSQN